VARSTRAMPPCPIARASVAAQRRRDRSMNTGASAACFDRSVPNCTRHGTIPLATVQVISSSYCLTGPYSGICNSVRLPRAVLNSSHIHLLKAGTETYAQEVQKNRKLEDIASSLALDVSYFNLSEYHKSGALLSCMVMHLNRQAYKFALT